MPEQFALEQLKRYCSAVYSYKGFTRSGAKMVERTST
jgi:hypothetical protein